MKLTRLKQLLAMAGVAVGLVGGAVLLTTAAMVVVRAGTGADPGDAFTRADVIPESLRGTVTWLEDAPDLDRAMEPSTRTALEVAWLSAAAATDLDPRGPARQTDHRLTVDFYSLDGQIVGLTTSSLRNHELADTDVWLRESFDVVMMLTDGRWEIDHKVRMAARTVPGTS